MNDDLLPQVCRVASDVLNVPIESVTENSSPETIEGWDSVQHLNLVLALEQQLGVQFEPEDIERMTSIEAILSTVRDKRG